MFQVGALAAGGEAAKPPGWKPSACGGRLCRRRRRPA